MGTLEVFNVFIMCIITVEIPLKEQAHVVVLEDECGTVECGAAVEV